MHKHILVFDSGLGGTTVLKEIKHLLPDNHYSYALDNEAYPYGNKSAGYLLDRCQLYMEKLIQQAAPDCIVIACNTASTLVLDQLRQRFRCDFVGVVPALKPAATHSRSKVIALLATPATVGRDYIDHLEQSHASDCEILRLGSQALVHLAEEKILSLQLLSV